MTPEPDTQPRRIADCYEEINAGMRRIAREKIPLRCGECGSLHYHGWYGRSVFIPEAQCADCGKQGARQAGEGW